MLFFQSLLRYKVFSYTICVYLVFRVIYVCFLQNDSGLTRSTLNQRSLHLTRNRQIDIGAISASLDSEQCLHAPQHFGVPNFAHPTDHSWHACLVHHHCRTHSCAERLGLELNTRKEALRILSCHSPNLLTPGKSSIERDCPSWCSQTWHTWNCQTVTYWGNRVFPGYVGTTWFLGRTNVYCLHGRRSKG